MTHIFVGETKLLQVLPVFSSDSIKSTLNFTQSALKTDDFTGVASLSIPRLVLVIIQFSLKSEDLILSLSSGSHVVVQIVGQIVAFLGMEAQVFLQLLIVDYHPVCLLFQVLGSYDCLLLCSYLSPH